MKGADQGYYAIKISAWYRHNMATEVLDCGCLPGKGFYKTMPQSKKCDNVLTNANII